MSTSSAGNPTSSSRAWAYWWPPTAETKWASLPTTTGTPSRRQTASISFTLAAELTREQAGEREYYLFRLRNAQKLDEQGKRAAPPFSLVFGNEASGLPKELESFGRGVIIPHSRAIDSLNLAVAAGIGLFAFSPTRGEK